MKKFKLHWQILIALVLAIAYGLLSPTSHQLTSKSLKSLRKAGLPERVREDLQGLSDKEYDSMESFTERLEQLLSEKDLEKYGRDIYDASYHNGPVKAVSWMGDLFLRALKMIIIPLIISSLISGVTNIGTGSNLGRIGIKTISYYILTSSLAIVTGLILVNLIKPGAGADLNFTQHVSGLLERHQSLGRTLIEIVPENFFTAITQNQMLSVIFFSVLFGFFIMRVSPGSRDILSRAFNAIFEVMMKITLFVIRFTPLGIFGIVAKVVADQDDLVNLMARMGLYMSTVVVALLIHFLITLPLIVRYIGNSNPFRHLNNMTTPLLTAFSTSSSGATLPLTMDAVENNSGVSNKISSFTLPLGATINMDGTALYECVAAMFIAQAYGVDMSIVKQLVVVVTALLASIGAAAIPMAGLVMITVILTAVGLPLEGVGLILAVDRILDMFRTATNVWSDSCGAVVIAKSEGEQLKI